MHFHASLVLYRRSLSSLLPRLPFFSFGFFVRILILGIRPLSKWMLMRTTMVGLSRGPRVRRREREEGWYVSEKWTWRASRASLGSGSQGNA